MIQYALVTGANRGISLEVCRQLAQHGFTVYAWSLCQDHRTAKISTLSYAAYAVKPAHRHLLRS